jgi:hypothetical protein
MGVIVKRAIRVKAVVTEEFRARCVADVTAVLSKLESDGQALLARMDALRNAANAGPRMERLEQALRRNERARADAAAELDKANALAIGGEYDRGVLEGFVEVNVGDDFTRLVDCEIVVKEDKVVEIRDGRCPQSGRTS